MVCLMDPESLVPTAHPIRSIKKLADDILSEMSPVFDEVYAERGRASVPPERLLKSMLLMALYGVRTERLLCERLRYNMMFRWFLDMSMSEDVFDASTFSKNRDRYVTGACRDEGACCHRRTDDARGRLGEEPDMSAHRGRDQWLDEGRRAHGQDALQRRDEIEGRVDDVWGRLQLAEDVEAAGPCVTRRIGARLCGSAAAAKPSTKARGTQPASGIWRRPPALETKQPIFSMPLGIDVLGGSGMTLHEEQVTRGKKLDGREEVEGRRSLAPSVGDLLDLTAFRRSAKNRLSLPVAEAGRAGGRARRRGGRLWQRGPVPGRVGEVALEGVRCGCGGVPGLRRSPSPVGAVT